MSARAVYLGTGPDRRLLRLGALLGEGAAGKVYAVDDVPGMAAKLYHGAKECRQHEAKIDAMLAHRPSLPPALHDGARYPQIAWPEAKLHDRDGGFVGFLMPEIDFARSTNLVNLLQKSSRRAERISDYYGYRVLVARNLASVFAELHRAGHHMIDMKPANLRFYPLVSWMAVVDTDGFSIAECGGSRIPAEQVSDEYIAPESWQRAPKELGVEQDRFALAVIIFQLLNNGVHPYAGGGGTASDLQTRIVEGLYPYGLRVRPALKPSVASVHRMFRRATRQCFDRAFAGTPAQRPSAEEWRDHLDVLIGQLVPCSARPADHAHFGVGCGFCAHEARVAASRQIAAEARPAPAAPRTVSAPALAPRRATMPPPRRSRRAPPPIAARPVPRLAQPYRVPRRRSSWPLWTVALAFIGTIAAAGAGADRYLPGLRALIQPAAFPLAAAAAAETAPQAPARSFEKPREYLVLPATGALSVAMHRSPGAEEPVIEQLDMHESVLGLGEEIAADGSSWVYVSHGAGGTTGYVEADALLLRMHNGEAATTTAGADAQMPAQGGMRAIETRYRSLLARAGRDDRIDLMTGQELWQDERRRCARDFNPAGCLRRADSSRIAMLDAWEQTESLRRDLGRGASGDRVVTAEAAPTTYAAGLRLR